jgi:GNAT superfamily N-acetyltransferase
VRPGLPPFRHASPMDVRAATPEDAAAIEALVPGADTALLSDGASFVAEDGGSLVGALVANPNGTIGVLAVAEGAQDRGVGRLLAQALVAELTSRGVEKVRAEVRAGDDEGLRLAHQFGFRTEHTVLATPVADLAARLESQGGPCYGAIHVQTDDEEPVRRALGRFVPRLPEARLTGPRNGWIEVTDPQLDADPALLRRLGHELSVVSAGVVFVLGVEDGAVVRYALLDRGSLVDEYVSVPEFHGPLPSGEVVALGANPTAVARLTGADAAQVRAVCRSAPSPADLPPADELYRQIAEVVGLSA